MSQSSSGSQQSAAIKKPDNPIKENKMGTMPINRLLISVSLPMVMSMLVQALYNIVDSAFVARISNDPVVVENALSALSCAFPVQNLMIAVAVGTGVGVNALLSRSLGEKNFGVANRTAGNAIFLAFCSYLVFAIAGIIGVKLYINIQTEDAQLRQFGYDYLYVITLFSFGVFGQVTFERLLQATGRSIFSMITQATGAIINIILDPILIFGLCGFKPMGVKGAAIATVIGQIVAMALGLFFNLKYNKDIKLSWKNIIPSGNIIGRIYIVGVPSIVMNSVSSIMTFAINKILFSLSIATSSTATSVFGLYYKLQSFVFMPVMGLNNGMIPIIAYNYGAKNKKRITDTIRLSVIYAVAFMLIGLALFQCFPEWMLGLFKATEDMITIGVPALRIISLSFIFAGFCIVSISVFQALGNGVFSLIISVTRQLVVLVPVAILAAVFLVPLTNQLWPVWTAFPIAEIVSVILCAIFLRVTLKKLKF